MNQVLNKKILLENKPTAAQTKIRIISNCQGFDALENDWDKLVSKTNSFIYQTFDWNRTWWKHFGKPGRLFLILFYSENKIVGIAPLFWDNYQLFGQRVYAALRFIGSYISQPKGEALIGLESYSDYLDLIAEPGYEGVVARSLARFIKNSHQFYDQIILDEAHEKSVVLNYLVPALKNCGTLTEVIQSSTCTVISLNHSWESYLNRLSKNSRKKARRYLKEVEDEKNKNFYFEDVKTREKLQAVFECLVQIHQKQWNNKGFPGTFYEKRMREFTKEVCNRFFQKGWVSIKILTAVNERDKIINAEMYFTYRDRIYSIIGGIDPNSPHVDKGVGNIIFTKVLKGAIENGYKTFDYLRGLEKYKIRRGDHFLPNKRVLVRNPLKKRSLRIPLVQQQIKAFRRARIEAIQLRLCFKNRGLVDGSRNYYSFLSNRISKKKPSAN